MAHPREIDVVYQPDSERSDLDATVAALLSRLREFDPHPYRIARAVAQHAGR
jgi:hypothetical protein